MDICNRMIPLYECISLSPCLLLQVQILELDQPFSTISFDDKQSDPVQNVSDVSQLLGGKKKESKGELHECVCGTISVCVCLADCSTQVV